MVAKPMNDRSESPGGDAPPSPAGGNASRERLLDRVLDALPVGVEVHDAGGGLVLRNRAAQEADEPGRHVERCDLRVAGKDYALTTFLDLAARTEAEDELFRRAYFDELTGLPNRSYLQHVVGDLIAGTATGSCFALAFVDIDNFKHINDYYSHAVGDEILVKIARRISGELRDGDVLARIGGDEFVLLLNPVGDPQDVVADIGHLLARLKQPFFVDGHEVFTSASIGISVCPQHGRDYNALRRNADLAMYRVKGARKGAVAMFDEDMRNAATTRMETEQRLRLAIRDRRFLCAYQPKVDIHSREIVGLEVLLRWRDEQGIFHPPGDFIGLAVELGLINEITHLVLDQTVAALDDIDATFGPGTSISLNVAARQAGDIAFMTTFADNIAATGCAERFMVELTEEAFFAKSELQTRILPLFRQMGTRVSIDDFGVGYSSLSALADLTADEIKIDRSFITDIHRRPRSQSILKAIESLGHALGMSIIAEGLETGEELTYLTAATRIRYAQGYYFSKPQFLHQLAATRTVSYLYPCRSCARPRFGAAP